MKGKLILFLLVLFLTIQSVSAWESNSDVINGLTDKGSCSIPAVYDDSGTWKLISGYSDGTWSGWYWSGSAWVSDSGVISGLTDNGAHSAPTVFNDSGILKLITGDTYGSFFGYQWNGATWVSNASIISGLGDIGWESRPTVFDDSGTWKLIAGEGETTGPFYGWYWSGSAWVSDSNIVNGLPSYGSGVYPTPTTYYDSDTLKLIVGLESGGFAGFYWNGTSWISDSDIVAGLGDIGWDAAPTVFDDDGTLTLIAGKNAGDFRGFRHLLQPAIPISLNSVVNYEWINWTWAAGSGGIVDTDSYNVSVNGSWTNGSANTYYNHNLPSGGTSTIIVWAYNSSHDVLSGGSITDSRQLLQPAIPISLNSVVNYEWINWTWAGGSGGALDTDSYNVSVNGSWTNGSANTYYNHNLPSGGTSTIIVWAYNSSYDVLSGGSLTGGRLTAFAPSIGKWTNNPSIVTGLGSVGASSKPTVYDDSGIWKLIAGESDGTFNGFQWNGTSWVSNLSIVTGLGNIGGSSTPTVFNDTGTWKLITGNNMGQFHGWYWNGTSWIYDTSIVNGLGDIGSLSTPTVYNDSGTLKLISGEDDGVFNGYYWNGTSWISDPSIVTGLGDIGDRSAPAVFKDLLTWKLIAGEYNGGFTGYRWSDNSWVSDPSITTGIGSVYFFTGLTVFNDAGTKKFIAGDFNGGFTGYYRSAGPTCTPPDPINLANSIHDFRVNFTFAAGSGNVTDSYFIRTNNGTGNIWNNGSLNSFSNTSTSPHGYVEIVVYGYNESGEGTFSTGYLTDNVTIPNYPVIITDIVNYSINEYELLFIDVNATDLDGDTPTFSCNRTDLFTDFNTATGIGSWTPSDIHSGNYSVKFGVNDGYGSTDNQTTFIVVADTVDPNPGEGEGGTITWNRISDYPGDSTITQGTSPSFGIGRKGYAIASNQELWEFNADSGSWTQKTDVSSSPENPTYLTINDKAYIMGGVESGVVTGKVREYIPSTNLWNEERDEYTISGGETGVVLPVIEDGYVFKYAPDTNYSTPGPLYIGDNRNAYLKYDISGIPSNARITDITQYIYWNGHCSLCGIEGNPTYTRKTTSNWNSNTLTWNNQPTVQTSSITVNFHMWFNQPSIGSPASSHIQDSIDDGDSWYGTQITTFSEPGPNNNVYGSFNSIEDCAGCPELWKTLLPGSQIVVDWVPKLELMVASFDIGDKGYTLTADGNLHSYDQFSDSWQDYSSIPSSDDVTWAISYNGKGYALVGNTMWEYTPSGDDWNEMSSTSHFNTLEYPAGFILEDIIYVGTGLLDGTKTASIFSFNPATDTWALESTSFPSARSRAIAFSIDNGDGSKTAYMGGGIGSVLHDFYEMDITPAARPTSTPIFIIPDIILPIEEFEFPELEVPEILEDTIFEEILIFIGKIFSWLFILAAYFGAFVASVILMRENQDFDDTKYNIFFFGTVGWVLPLLINSINLLELVTQNFWLNALIFAVSGFVVYAILNMFGGED